MNFKFLRSHTFREVNQGEWSDTISYCNQMGLHSSYKPEYDNENHELFETYQLNKDNWDKLCGEMPEGSTKVIGYKINDLHTSQYRYYLHVVVVGLPWMRNELDGVYNVAA